MNGDAIIAEARLNFGEITASTVTDPNVKSWVNTGLKELYSLLPLSELLVLATTDTVTLTDGKGSLPATLDHFLGAQVADAAAGEVSVGAIGAIDQNAYFTPFRHVYASDGEHLWVRGPTEPADATVTFIAPPAEITDFTAQVVLPKWHAALVLLVTAFAYAQEEDKGQAQHYRNEALALINRTATAPEQEAL